MGLRVSFELDDNDLKHFRLIMVEARKAAARMAPEDIVAAAEQVLRDIGDDEAPGFIIERLGKLKQMIRMITDVEWRLPHEETGRVLNALAYFAEPDDLIPDSIPGVGFLDDAIMVELVFRELRHEIEAYDDFCEFRAAASEASKPRKVSRKNWLDSRREELQSRMRRRRSKTLQRSSPSSGLRLLD